MSGFWGQENTKTFIGRAIRAEETLFGVRTEDRLVRDEKRGGKETHNFHQESVKSTGRTTTGKEQKYDCSKKGSVGKRKEKKEEVLFGEKYKERNNRGGALKGEKGS